MTPDLAELMAALPTSDEDAAAGIDAQDLQQLFARLERRRAPASALHRFGVLAGLQAQIARLRSRVDMRTIDREELPVTGWEVPA
jgi:hypothetical protein